MRAVPVINENDTVATSEIRYGDNDRLAARVATMASADLLILLSDIAGLYDAPPQDDPQARADPGGRAGDAGDRGDGGRRGLGAVARRHAHQDRGGAHRDRRRRAHGHRRRPRAASDRARRRGRALHLVPDAVQSGRGAKGLDRRLAGAEGRGDVDAGAARALAQRQEPAAGRASRAIEGAFARGDCVAIRDERGAEIGRGLIAYDALHAERIRGRNSRDIAHILGTPGRAEMIHRDDMALAGR